MADSIWPSICSVPENGLRAVVSVQLRGSAVAPARPLRTRGGGGSQERARQSGRRAPGRLYRRGGHARDVRDALGGPPPPSRPRDSGGGPVPVSPSAGRDSHRSCSTCRSCRASVIAGADGTTGGRRPSKVRRRVLRHRCRPHPRNPAPAAKRGSSGSDEDRRQHRSVLRERVGSRGAGSPQARARYWAGYVGGERGDRAADDRGLHQR
jgi:hypothetical protein